VSPERSFCGVLCAGAIAGETILITMKKIVDILDIYFLAERL
jgi:hypothetical protein